MARYNLRHRPSSRGVYAAGDTPRPLSPTRTASMSPNPLSPNRKGEHSDLDQGDGAPPLFLPLDAASSGQGGAPPLSTLMQLPAGAEDDTQSISTQEGETVDIDQVLDDLIRQHFTRNREPRFGLGQDGRYYVYTEKDDKLFLWDKQTAKYTKQNGKTRVRLMTEKEQQKALRKSPVHIPPHPHRQVKWVNRPTVAPVTAVSQSRPKQTVSPGKSVLKRPPLDPTFQPPTEEVVLQLFQKPDEEEEGSDEEEEDKLDMPPEFYAADDEAPNEVTDENVPPPSRRADDLDAQWYHTAMKDQLRSIQMIAIESASTLTEEEKDYLFEMSESSRWDHGLDPRLPSTSAAREAPASPDSPDEDGDAYVPRLSSRRRRRTEEEEGGASPTYPPLIDAVDTTVSPGFATPDEGDTSPLFQSTEGQSGIFSLPCIPVPAADASPSVPRESTSTSSSSSPTLAETFKDKATDVLRSTLPLLHPSPGIKQKAVPRKSNKRQVPFDIADLYLPEDGDQEAEKTLYTERASESPSKRPRV